MRKVGSPLIRYEPEAAVKSTLMVRGVIFTAGVTGVSVRGASESRGDMHDGISATTDIVRSAAIIVERVVCVIRIGQSC